MSSDEVFAAQMWTWPGPMLKRDPSGRVTVVNAAFIQLYGGTVQAWTGNAVTGWPEPQPAGTTSRFEARIPQADGTEAVYDWIETTLGDGSCLAIARDVSMFMQAAAPIQAPAAEPEAPQQQAQNYHQEAPPVEQYAVQGGSYETGNYETSAYEAPQQQQAVASQQQEQQPAPPPAQMTGTADALPVMNTQYAPPPAQEPQRDFERRALPIENGDSVLGNNWRDAVIAKAVGVEDIEAGGEPNKMSQPDATDDGKQAGGVRILLAEDNAINALLTRTLLEAEGCIVEVVEDGALAVEAMRNASYDMIFMDMRMPNMDGLEATRKIRAMDHRSKGLPIVALTANAFDDDRNACFDSGMNDFMTKPVSAEELSEMVRVHTGKSEERLAG